MSDRTVVDRFWSKVQVGQPSECWPWTGCRQKDGYGRFYIGKRPITASRFAYQLAHSEVDIDAVTLVCHRCDNPPCVNPAHLFLGTDADNTADRHRKGRTAAGVGHGMAKLTPTEVLTIRDLSAAGVSRRRVAARFGVSTTTVQRIVRRVNWRNI